MLVLNLLSDEIYAYINEASTGKNLSKNRAEAPGPETTKRS